MPAAIRADRLTKRFGELVAVDGVSFSVEEGEIFGFLGPNGAGKTTTIRMLTGVLSPDEGSVEIRGIPMQQDPVPAKMQMGIIPENSTVYGDLSAEENIMLAARFYGLSLPRARERIDRLLSTLGIADRRSEPVRRFSKGLAQRVSIACAVVHDPPVLFLDEPTEGLDPRSRRLITEMIREMNRDGTTVFFTTHNIEEADTLCHRVGIIRGGRIVALDRPAQLRRMFEETRSVMVSFAEEADRAWFSGTPVVRVEENAGGIRLYTPDPDAVIKRVAEIAGKRRLTITALSTSGPSLEEAFLRITGGEDP